MPGSTIYPFVVKRSQITPRRTEHVSFCPFFVISIGMMSFELRSVELTTKQSKKKEISIMKARHVFVYIIAALVGLPLVGTAASAATIEVVETFDFPGVGRLTEPQKINDRGDIVGSVVDTVDAA